MSYTNTGRFQYNFTRQSQFEQLRQKNLELQQENNQLKSSIQQLLEINGVLTQKLQELEKLNIQGQNAQEMQQKIQLLTEEVQTLRRQIEQVQYQKSKTSNRRDSNAAYYEQTNKQTQQVVQVLEELTQSFQHMQDKYQAQIDSLQNDLNVIKGQSQINVKKLQQQYSQKIHNFQDVIIQLKRKDELVNMIQDKLRMAQDAIKALAQGSLLQRQSGSNRDKDGQVNGINLKSGNTKTNSNQNNNIQLQERQRVLLKQIEQKNRFISMYQQLVAAMKEKLI